MKVVYSIGAKLGGAGIGTPGLQAVLGLKKAGVLDRVLASYPTPGFAMEKEARFWGWSGRILRRLAYLSGRDAGYYPHDLLYDLWASRHLPSSFTFLHGWNGHSLHTLRVAKRKGAQVVVERASSHVLTGESVLREEFKRWGIAAPPLFSLNRKRMLTELNEADFVLVPSEYARLTFLEQGFPQDKLRLIPFGMGSDPFSGSDPVLGSDPILGTGLLKKRGTTFLFVGRIGLLKGVHFLLEAWKKAALKNAELWLVGDKLREWETVVKKRPDLVSQKNVVFLGFRRDVSVLMRLADVFVFPSLNEGSALVTYEALGAGLPQILTFESGSVLEDGKQGYLIGAGQVEELVERMRFLHHHPAVRQKLSRAALEKAKEYTWEKYKERLVATYRKLN